MSKEIPVLALIDQSKAAIAEAAPQGTDVARFLRLARLAVVMNPQIQDCEPSSVIRALMQAAALGLDPTGTIGLPGGCYIVPYRDRKSGKLRAQLQIGYKGFIDLLHRSGVVRAVEAQVVHQADHFVVRYGLNPELLHEPAITPDRGPVVAVWGLVHLRDGSPVFTVMTAAEIEQHRQRYVKATGDDSPWQTAWDEMAKKTVLLKLLRRLPPSPVTQRAEEVELEAESASDAAAELATASAEVATAIRQRELLEKAKRARLAPPEAPPPPAPEEQPEETKAEPKAPEPSEPGSPALGGALFPDVPTGMGRL